MTGGVRGANGMGIAGTVATNDGSTLTVTTKARPNGGTATTYTVSTSSSTTVTKNGTTSSVSDIAVGDTVMVQEQLAVQALLQRLLEMVNLNQQSRVMASQLWQEALHQQMEPILSKSQIKAMFRTQLPLQAQQNLL